jgi:hypothetical protein
VNQLARKRRKDVDLLLDAGHKLALVQRALLTGGDKQAFERASAAERKALNRLVQAAESIFPGCASAATLTRVSSTLHAAAVSDAARADLARGRLTTDVDPAGFEAFAGDATSAATPTLKAQPRRAASNERAARQRAEQEAAARRAAVARSKAKLKSAKTREASLASKLHAAERSERAALTAHKQAERTVERLRAEHKAATSAVQVAQDKLEQAQRNKLTP